MVGGRFFYWSLNESLNEKGILIDFTRILAYYYGVRIPPAAYHGEALIIQRFPFFYLFYAV